MIRILTKRRFGPIGVDIGSRSIKLIQLTADHSAVVDAARWDLPAELAQESDDQRRADVVAEAIHRACDGRRFRGRRAAVCLRRDDVFLQNLRIPKGDARDLTRLVQQETAARLPFPIAEAELRYVEASEIRQGEGTSRELIVFACQRDRLQRRLDLVEQAGLTPVALEVEPAALLRSFLIQSRREEDRQQRAIFAHIGFANTAVVIAQGNHVLFAKYVEIGGKQMDEAVARHLNMSLPEATALRRHNGDRRADQQDPEVSRGIARAVRPVVEQLAAELALCIRYHSVTFRGQTLARLVLGGGEASPALLESLAARIDLKCELGDPLRAFPCEVGAQRRGQWDVAVGLALRPFD